MTSRRPAVTMSPMADKEKPPDTGLDPSLRGFIKETARDTGFRKAARFLMLLGKEEAARVLRHLSAQEVEGIAKEIARTQNIEQSEAGKILEEFGYIRQTKDLVTTGGPDKAREMLVASVGETKAEEILARVTRELAPPPFSFLMDVDIHQAIALLRDESPPVIALILAHLEPKFAARVLSSLSREVQKEVVPRIAKLEKIDPDVIRRAEETLRAKLREQGTIVTQEVRGKAVLTEILKYMDHSRENVILSELEPNMANEIRKSLFTVDVILRIPNKDLQQALRDYSQSDMALMLKAMAPELRERLLSNVSTHRRELILSELESMGPVPKSHADAALDEFLGYLQLLEQRGEITVLREQDELV